MNRRWALAGAAILVAVVVLAVMVVHRGPDDRITDSEVRAFAGPGVSDADGCEPDPDQGTGEVGYWCDFGDGYRVRYSRSATIADRTRYLANLRESEGEPNGLTYDVDRPWSDPRGRPGRLLGGTQQQEFDNDDGERWFIWYRDDVAVLAELSTDTRDAGDADAFRRRITRAR
jgi:hypothetical protein